MRKRESIDREREVKDGLQPTAADIRVTTKPETERLPALLSFKRHDLLGHFAQQHIQQVVIRMDDYPGAEPIPEPAGDIDARYSTLLEFLTDNSEMRKVAKSSFKQALWSGAGAMGGGLVFGAVGGLVGGIAGSIYGFMTTPNYDGALVHLCGLPEEEKKALLTRVGQVLMAAGAAAHTMNSQAAFRDALMMYAAQPSVRNGLWNACVASLQE